MKMKHELSYGARVKLSSHYVSRGYSFEFLGNLERMTHWSAATMNKIVDKIKTEGPQGTLKYAHQKVSRMVKACSILTKNDGIALSILVI